MNPWDHLPNAHLIDQALASLKEHPYKWDAVWNAARIGAMDADGNATWNATWIATWNASWNEAWDATMIKARDVAANAAWNASCDADWNAHCGAILALIAYDYSAKFLDMTADELEACAALSHNPAAVLLLPAVRVFESINKVTI